MVVPSMLTTRLMAMLAMLLMLPMMELLSTQMPQHLTVPPQSLPMLDRVDTTNKTDEKKIDNFNNIDHQD